MKFIRLSLNFFSKTASLSEPDVFISLFICLKTPNSEALLLLLYLFDAFLYQGCATFVPFNNPLVLGLPTDWYSLLFGKNRCVLVLLISLFRHVSNPHIVMCRNDIKIARTLVKYFLVFEIHTH